MRFRHVIIAGAAGFSLLYAASFAATDGGRKSADAQVLAPGWGQLEYEPPAPGTYDLPVIRPAAGGEVLKADGDAADLGEFLHGKISVLSFMYTSCDDVNGCPLSLFVFHRLQDQFKKDPGVADDVRLISFSFDVEKDTPEVLREYESEHAGAGHAHHAHHAGHQHHAGHTGKQEAGAKESPKESRGEVAAKESKRKAGAEWLFLVAKSERSLDPVLKAYSQFVIPEFNEDHETTGKFSHLLRVFLIDKQGRVRNIYSPSFLHPDVLLADIKSLLLMDAES